MQFPLKNKEGKSDGKEEERGRYTETMPLKQNKRRYFLKHGFTYLEFLI